MGSTLLQTPRKSMPSHRWPRLLAALVAGALLSCAPSSKVQPRACSSNPDCPSQTLCVLGACVADALPIAEIVTPERIASHRYVTLDGTRSRDTDPGDSVTAYSWAVKERAGAACAASPAHGTTATLKTLFPCGGDYDVELRVKDAFGAESVPAQQRLTVAPSMDPPQVTSVAEPLTIGHRCVDRVCEPYDDATGLVGLQLAVTATDVQDADRLSYEWSFKPPDGVDRDAVTVKFDPDAHTRSPTVHITTNATRIAGEWTFTVAVTDFDGLTSTADQKITVTNRPPSVQAPGEVSTGHKFANVNYVAQGSATAAVSDPDGDPLDVQVTLDEARASSCSFRLVDKTSLSAPTVLANFEVQCADPHDLIGLERFLHFQVTDPNGEVVEARARLTITNHAPFLVWNPDVPGGPSQTLSVSHRVQPCARGTCYAVEADAPLQVIDLDGDPLSPIKLEPLGIDGSSTFTSTGAHFTLETTVGSPLSFRNSDGSTPVSIRATVSDAWASSEPTSAASLFHLRIGNQPPSPATPANPAVAHRYSDATREYTAEADVLQFNDADGGEPITSMKVESAPGEICSSALAGRTAHVTCRLPYDWRSGAPPNIRSLVGQHAFQMSASDAWSAGPAVKAGLTVMNNAPVLTGGFVHVEACRCMRRADLLLWADDTQGVFEPRISDADGDPFHVTASVAGGTVSPTELVTLGPASFTVTTATLNSTMMATVAADDGAQSSAATYTLELSCSKRGQECGVARCVGPCP